MTSCCPGCWNVAVIVVCPAVAPLASPTLLIGATFGAEDVHVTWLVKSTCFPSLKVPTALNCWLVPAVIVLFFGVMTSWVIVALETFRVVLPVIPANTAVTVVAPGLTPVAMPCLPEALLTVATEELDDAHVALCVKLICCTPAVPVAVNGIDTPT